MLLRGDEAEEGVFQPEPDDVVLDDGQLPLRGKGRDRGLDGTGRLWLDANDEVADVPVALGKLDAQDAGQRGQADRGSVDSPTDDDAQLVLVEAGQTIEAGQPLIVLQAMKMENELSVPRGGAISAVLVTEGQTVEAGQILASLD